MNRAISLLLVLCLLGLSGLRASYAAEPLTFSYAPSSSEAILLDGVLEEGVDKYLYATSDLNEDGIDEIFVKSAECSEAQNRMCDHFVYGLGQNKAHLLLRVRAWGLSVTDLKQHGVRRLLVFKNPINQFKSSAYTWNALKSRYTVAEGEDKI